MTETSIGRNEPCPCGSGKKYKRCCGVSAAPKLSTPAPRNIPAGFPGGGNIEQFRDQMDPQMMQQFAQMMGRLPKGQLQKLQSIMQRAMAGKDVTREAQEFEHSLPLDVQTLLHSMQMPGMPQTSEIPAVVGSEPLSIPEIPSAPVEAGISATEGQMSEEEARRIVEAAAKEGKISTEEASELLQPKGGISKLWKKIARK